MKILEVLHEETILTDLKSTDKKGVLEELVVPVAKMTGIDREKLVRIIMERERLGSTGIDGGIGIPHGKLKELKAPVIGFGLSKKGVNFESMDGRPTHIFFLLCTPEDSTGLHLKLLARISRLLKNEGIKKKLKTISKKEDVISIIEADDEDF
jgi:nitrogen PTS system EIIA component